MIFTKQQIGFNDDVDSIRSAILTIVKESHLSALDPSVSVQQRFHGKLKRKKVGVRDLSSISLFVDDVERLLRDLYGDLGAHAFDELLRAITSVVIEFTMYVRPDLQDEYNHADDFDDMAGIRFPEGYALSSSGYRRASAAAEALVNRARQVRVNPDGFSRYTRQFVKTFCKRWPKLNGRNRTSYYDDI